jgi:hypothetical protein
MQNQVENNEHQHVDSYNCSIPEKEDQLELKRLETTTKNFSDQSEITLQENNFEGEQQTGQDITDKKNQGIHSNNKFTDI